MLSGTAKEHCSVATSWNHWSTSYRDQGEDSQEATLELVQEQD